MPRVLLVDDEPSILSVLSTLLKQQGYEITPALGGVKAKDLLQAESFDLMISDIRMSPVNGLELLKYAKSIQPGLCVIMVTGYGSVETAVAAMKDGAYDYVTKPFKVDELMLTVQRALEHRRVLVENAVLKQQFETRYGFENMVAESPAMRRLCEMIRRVAPTEQTVLIGGESGTGKEVIAKAIHAHSVRKAKVFVPINCAAMPEPLLESELFGHMKGSFTGAASDKEGLFEVADGGTIFLDEIGSMPLSLQGKLLRVLQERELRRVGGTRQIKVNVRVIAASNENIEERIREGKFREDLYFRLSVIPLEIAPLRERREDILPLAYHFIRGVHPNPVHQPTLDADTQSVLEAYAWPGNVRELQNAIHHACTFAKDGVITLADLPARLLKAAGVAVNAAGAVAGPPPEAFAGKSLKAYLRQKEAQYIESAIRHFQGSKEQAAAALKVSLATLYRKMPEAE
jgi:DNA-binding NtrC family response regulator